MDWKDFFRITKGKIWLSILFIFILPAYTVSCSYGLPDGPSCHSGWIFPIFVLIYLVSFLVRPLFVPAGVGIFLKISNTFDSYPLHPLGIIFSGYIVVHIILAYLLSSLIVYLYHKYRGKF